MQRKYRIYLEEAHNAKELESWRFEEAAEVIGVKKKRRMTPEQKEKLVEMGRKHHFKSKTNGDKAEFKQI